MSSRLVYIFGVAMLAAMLVGCGGSGASQDEIDRARTEGEAQARQEAKIEGLEKQVRSINHGHGSTSPGTTTTSPAPAPTTTAGSGNCGGELSVGANTTCPFAQNVQSDYYSEIGSGSGTVVSYSPVTGKVYSMYCTAGEPHECTGGNNASVFFP